jgi:hypothetical protein
MIKVVKWIYELGYRNARTEIIKDLQRLHTQHVNRAEIASLRKLEEKIRRDYVGKGAGTAAISTITPEEHYAIACAIYAYMGELEPEKYRNIDWELKNM